MGDIVTRDAILLVVRVWAHLVSIVLRGVTILWVGAHLIAYLTGIVGALMDWRCVFVV